MTASGAARAIPRTRRGTRGGAGRFDPGDRDPDAAAGSVSARVRVDAVLLDQAAERPAILARLARGARDVAVVFGEEIGDELLLERLDGLGLGVAEGGGERDRRVRRGRRRRASDSAAGAAAEVARSPASDPVPVDHHRRALDQVEELAHVSGEIVTRELRQRARREAQASSRGVGRAALEEMRGQKRNV